MWMLRHDTGRGWETHLGWPNNDSVLVYTQESPTVLMHMLIKHLIHTLYCIINEW